MDFPDVTTILQVGLPANADAYTHRVGRTARAGKDGRAVLLLTEAESFFLNVNSQFPINPYPASDRILNDRSSRKQIFKVLKSIEPLKKERAYSAYLGFMRSFMKPMHMDNTKLVQMANTLAIEGFQCSEVPMIDPMAVGKMGMKGVPGLRIGKAHSEGHSGRSV